MERAVLILMLVGPSLAASARQRPETVTSDRRPPHASFLTQFSHMPPPPPVSAQRLKVAKSYTLTQRLDHFNPSDLRTWKQRYFSDSEFYRTGGPTFIFVDGESTANPSWLVGSYMAEMASKLHAQMFLIEHRYYGESRPTPDATTDNLRWLTVDQALADVAYFITQLRAAGRLDPDSKVVCFGGSYAGNLVTWMRVRYPHLVHSSVASSAPIRAKMNFPEYLSVVTRSLRVKAGQWCVDTIRKGTDRMAQLLQTESGVRTLDRLFQSCSHLNVEDTYDLDNLFETVVAPFAVAVQYNRAKGLTDSITDVCKKISPVPGLDESPDIVLERLARLTTTTADNNTSCVDYSFDALVDFLKNDRWESEATSSGYRQWIYQTCTEFGYFQTGDAEDQPFGYRRFSLPFFVEICQSVYGSKFNDDEIAFGVARTNAQFGGLTPEVSRVILVNGDIDPWHALSALQDLNCLTPAILISGTSHCYDMYASKANDTIDLQRARHDIYQYLSFFLREDPQVSRCSS